MSKRLFMDPAGRVEMTADITEGPEGECTELRVEPRRLEMVSWNDAAWKDYHRGDRVTVEQRIGDSDWVFHGVVLFKRLRRIVIGEHRAPTR